MIQHNYTPTRLIRLDIGAAAPRPLTTPSLKDEIDVNWAHELSSWEKLSRGQFFEGRVLGATCERAYADATTRQVPTGGALGS